MQLTEHFALDEFTASETAHELGIDNVPTDEHLGHLRTLAAAMEDVRALFGRAIVITSGYRNPELNDAVGGVPDSAHALGYACDFHVAGQTDIQAAQTIAASALKWDQLIWEKGRCVHYSIDPKLRQDIMSQPGGPGSPVHRGIS